MRRVALVMCVGLALGAYYWNVPCHCGWAGEIATDWPVRVYTLMLPVAMTVWLAAALRIVPSWLLDVAVEAIVAAELMLAVSGVVPLAHPQTRVLLYLSYASLLAGEATRRPGRRGWTRRRRVVLGTYTGLMGAYIAGHTALSTLWAAGPAGLVAVSGFLEAYCAYELRVPSRGGAPSGGAETRHAGVWKA